MNIAVNRNVKSDISEQLTNFQRPSYDQYLEKDLRLPKISWKYQ